MPFSRFVRMRSRTSAMSASRSIGSGSPIWSELYRPPARATRRWSDADSADHGRAGAARANRVFALRGRPAEASLVHPDLVGRDGGPGGVVRSVDVHRHEA